MARHESEMHRQRRELLDALARFASQLETRVDPLQVAQQIRAAIRAVQPACDVGLFGDNRQMDLADRPDMRPGTYLKNKPSIPD